MTILAPKPTADTVLYTFDLKATLGDDTIASFTFVRTSGTVTIGTTANTDTAVTALLSGGADGETAGFTLTVTTAAGQVFARTYTLHVSNTASENPSTTTKRVLVNMAFEEMTLAGYEFDATPEEQASTMRRLDALMAEWATASLDLGYNFPATFGQGDLEDPTNIPDATVNTVIMQLALRSAPSIGKTLSPESRKALADGMIALRTAYAVIPRVSFPDGTVRGSGRSPWGRRWPFIVGDSGA